MGGWEAYIIFVLSVLLRGAGGMVQHGLKRSAEDN